jgi:hypothetical protein
MVCQQAAMLLLTALQGNTRQSLAPQRALRLALPAAATAAAAAAAAAVQLLLTCQDHHHHHHPQTFPPQI